MNFCQTLPFPRDKRIERPLRATIFILACVLVTGWAAVCAAAGEEGWRNYSKWEVTSFTVVGAPDDIASELNQGLAFSGQWKLLKGWERPPFLTRTLAEDLARIRLFLATHGYPAAQVVPSAVPLSESRELEIVITITVGEPIRIGSVSFDGWPEGVALPDTTVEGAVSSGDIFVDEKVALADIAVLSYLMDSGYALAKISRELLPLGPGLVGLQYLVEAGDFYVIDEVSVTGCSDDLTELVLRVVNISPGIEYSEEVVKNASLDLRLTQLFRVVEISTEAISPGHLRLIIDAQNGTMRVWDAAIGTWSDNPWAVRTSWTHRNFFERGRGLDLRASFATHELDVGFGVNWLGWLSPRARTRAGASLIVEREDAYNSKEFRAELIQSFRPRTRNILNLGTAISENRIEERFTSETDIPSAQGRLWEFWVDRKWEFTDNPMYPVEGGFIKVSLTAAEPWLISQVPYASLRVDLAHYLNLPGPFVFTSRLRAGAAKPLKEGIDVLANRRFYAGGYNSHRGYERRGLGPTDLEGNALGGEFVGLLSGELRFPLIWKLEGGLFIDSGNIWETAELTS
ncbi:MAG: outer membrane protein insertion porin family, partial [Candidatus Krumholzibacteriia bacterium]